MEFIYYKYSDYLKNKYGEKVYKLPISLQKITCPNRDGTVGYGGCTYCGEEGTAFEQKLGNLKIKEQLETHMQFITKKYKAKKFIAYFQSYSNTYTSFENFKTCINQAIIKNIVDISISTRPDCINKKYLDFLNKIKNKYNINITIELGLQTANYKSLLKVNRGHTLAEYIESAINIKNFDLDLCTHIILNLPYDDINDSIETAKIISVLKTDHVKLHALYIEKNTVMANQFLNKEFEICSLNEYVKRTITFLEYLNPQISIQRIIGRVPEEKSIFANWGTSWWKIKEQIETEMLKRKTYQGRLFNYTNGSLLSKFN